MDQTDNNPRESGEFLSRNSLNYNEIGPGFSGVGSSALPAGHPQDALGPVGLRRPRPPKLYRIGEVVEYSGMSRQTIHNYTAMGLLQENRWTRGGHRLYDESVFERLDLISDLKAQNKSLENIRDFLIRNDAS